MGRVIEGVVVRRAGDKTVTVEVTAVSRHALYMKKIVTTRRYLVHDPDNKAELGAAVKITESRPLSKRKRWSLLNPKP